MTNLNRIKSAIDDWKGSLSPTKASLSTNRRTLIIWLETPSNPLTKITDIRAVCDVAQTYNLCGKDGRIVTVVDSTWSPPNITQPLLVRLSDIRPDIKYPTTVNSIKQVLTNVKQIQRILVNHMQLGADAVLHSGTKYFGGHSDATLGLITTSPITLSGRELGPKLAQIQAVVGSIASPFDSWLCLRGLRTLVVR
jgi:cystathionine beta-lyase/cystathionine gamma-synthase